VNTYDPARYLVYVHLATETDFCSVPSVRTSQCRRLPNGYANRSARTRLGA
jgi:hypothetical protein